MLPVLRHGPRDTEQEEVAVLVRGLLFHHQFECLHDVPAETASSPVIRS
jgi:hypothetical protein